MLIYPQQEIWKPEPFWQRWRNSSGQRIRFSEGGARMNDSECCCGPPAPNFDCYACSADAPAQVSVVVTGVTGSGCTVDSCASVINTTYVLDYSGINPDSDTIHCGAVNDVCRWVLDLDYTEICQDDPVFGNDHEIYGAELVLGVCGGSFIGAWFAVKVKRTNAGEGCCAWIAWRDTNIANVGAVDCEADFYDLPMYTNAEACTANSSTATIDFSL